jgi:succinoglycan biosynthesis protein ExoM
MGLDLTYSIEATQTIPAARNHAVSLARGSYVAFIDDDECPPEEWLLRLYEGVQAFGTDGALGPVYPSFPDGAPGWLAKSRICELPSTSTGTQLHWSQTRTGNALVKKELFEKHGLAFDLRFKTGGSDQEFFRQAMAKGFRFVAIEEAPVYEIVPPARWTRKYWTKRALVNGFNARRYQSGGIARQAVVTFKSAAAVAAYAASFPVCAALGRHRSIRCLEKGCYHLSRACATFGIELWKKRDF